MKPLVRNRFIDAMFKTLLISAITHLFIMVMYVMRGGDYQTLNMFRVFGLTLFFPGIDGGVRSFFASQIIPIAIFVIAYIRLTK